MALCIGSCWLVRYLSSKSWTSDNLSSELGSTYRTIGFIVWLDMFLKFSRLKNSPTTLPGNLQSLVLGFLPPYSLGHRSLWGIWQKQWILLLTSTTKNMHRWHALNIVTNCRSLGDFDNPTLCPLRHRLRLCPFRTLD